MSHPLPATPAPELVVDLVGGGSFKLADQHPERFTMVAFYRGKHCPVCKKQLGQLRKMRDDFADAGVDIVAVSMDDEDRAGASVRDWDLDGLRVGYGLTEESARSWGLYLSSAASDSEPALFSEPGLFLVRPDGTLYAGLIGSVPFGRPDLDELRASIDFVIDKDYPPRGVVA